MAGCCHMGFQIIENYGLIDVKYIKVEGGNFFVVTWDFK